MNEDVTDHTSSTVGSSLLKYLTWLLYSLDYTQFSYADYNLFSPGYFFPVRVVVELGHAASFSQRTFWGQEVLFGVTNAGRTLRQRRPVQVVPGRCGEHMRICFAWCIWWWRRSLTQCSWSGSGSDISQVGGEALSASSVVGEPRWRSQRASLEASGHRTALHVFLSLCFLPSQTR